MTKKKKKKTEEQIKALIDYILEKVGLDDAMKTIAVVGMTVIIKNGIEWSEHIISQASTLPSLALWQLFPWTIVTQFGVDIEEVADLPKAEAIEWFISFACAYMIVTNPDMIFQSGKGIIDTAIKMIT